MLGIGLIAILLFFELSSGRVQEIIPVLDNHQSEPDILQPGPARQQQPRSNRRYRPLELQEIEEAEILPAAV